LFIQSNDRRCAAQGDLAKSGSADRQPKTNWRSTLIWLLVLLLAILAIAGGLALSKFLFILLILAVIVALLGARSTA
jgi:uncharacterized membrane protein YjdF